MKRTTTLTETTFQQGLDFLTAADADLAQIFTTLGPPPLWQREPGFPTLVHIILEQQVSLASALAAFNRLRIAVSPLTPEGFLTLDDQRLKEIGFSRQKTAYCRELARAILDKRLDLEALENAEDDLVRSTLLEMKGIGPWTAEIYLLMALRRPDIWPCGDLALVSAVRRVKRMAEPLTADTMETISLPWRPWRAVAARLLWHFYLSGGYPS